MARWIVADSLYSREAWFCSHLSSYSHFLREAGETVRSVCLNIPDLAEADIHAGDDFGDADYLFVLDRYDMAASGWRPDVKRIAQVAAICDPMPWQVRKADGTPAFDLVVSSLPWMVDEARAHGCRAEFMSLAFDTRALVASMGIKERDIPFLFVGTRGPNHRKREEILNALGDVVTIAPPTFGREYFKLLAMAKCVINVHAEWARGAANAMRIFESAGAGACIVTDGEFPLGVERFGWGYGEMTADDFRDSITSALRNPDAGAEDQAIVLQHHTYVQRVSDLISIARSL